MQQKTRLLLRTLFLTCVLLFNSLECVLHCPHGHMQVVGNITLITLQQTLWIKTRNGSTPITTCFKLIIKGKSSSDDHVFHRNICREYNMQFGWLTKNERQFLNEMLQKTEKLSSDSLAVFLARDDDLIELGLVEVTADITNAGSQMQLLEESLIDEEVCLFWRLADGQLTISPNGCRLNDADILVCRNIRGKRMDRKAKRSLRTQIPKGFWVWFIIGGGSIILALLVFIVCYLQYAASSAERERTIYEIQRAKMYASRMHNVVDQHKSSPYDRTSADEIPGRLLQKFVEQTGRLPKGVTPSTSAPSQAPPPPERTPPQPPPS